MSLIEFEFRFVTIRLSLLIRQRFYIYLLNELYFFALLFGYFQLENPD
jgi:hypothetical protein